MSQTDDQKRQARITQTFNTIREINHVLENALNSAFPTEYEFNGTSYFKPSKKYYITFKSLCNDYYNKESKQYVFIIEFPRGTDSNNTLLDFASIEKILKPPLEPFGFCELEYIKESTSNPETILVKFD